VKRLGLAAIKKNVVARRQPGGRTRSRFLGQQGGQKKALRTFSFRTGGEAGVAHEKGETGGRRFSQDKKKQRGSGVVMGRGVGGAVRHAT